jgi:hypothetical protein
VRRRGHGAQGAAFPCLVCLDAQFRGLVPRPC